MIPAANVNVAFFSRSRYLGMTAEAEIGIGLGEQLGIDGAVGAVTDGATFTKGGMFVNERTCLFAMAIGAHFILARHGEAAGGFHDVHAVRIMALDAVHFAFEHRMMLGIVKFRLDFQVALQASLGVLAGIDDEFFKPALAAHRNMFAAGAVAGFATVLAGHGAIIQMQARVGAGGKHAGDLLVAVGAGFVADIRGAFNFQRLDHGSISGTGTGK